MEENTLTCLLSFTVGIPQHRIERKGGRDESTLTCLLGFTVGILQHRIERKGGREGQRDGG